MLVFSQTKIQEAFCSICLELFHCSKLKHVTKLKPVRAFIELFSHDSGGNQKARNTAVTYNLFFDNSMYLGYTHHGSFHLPTNSGCITNVTKCY